MKGGPAVTPPRRRSLKDAARDPLTTKTKSDRSAARPARKREARGMPVLFQVGIGLLIGLAGGFVLGRFSRWI
jgi:hypothetical protein